MVRVYTRGKSGGVEVYDVDTSDVKAAIKAVTQEVASGHKAPVLARVK